MPKTSKKRGTDALVFQRRNYVLLALGVALVAVGFALMRIENQFEGFISLYVAPLIILAGYMEVIYAILWRPSSDDEDES
jgi:hypothetical protein